MPTTTNPLPQLIAPRLVKARDRIRNQIWETPVDLPALMGPLNDELLPLEAGAVKPTEACALPAVADPMVGAPGTVGGT